MQLPVCTQPVDQMSARGGTCTAQSPVTNPRRRITMKTRHSLFATLLLAGVTVTGCTSGDTTAGDDDGGDGGDGSGTQPVPTTPEGKFSVTSDFDIATNAPGTPGQIVNYFIQATDDPDDPTKFI